MVPVERKQNNHRTTMHKSFLTLRKLYRWLCFVPLVFFCKTRVYPCSSVVIKSCLVAACRAVQIRD